MGIEKRKTEEQVSDEVTLSMESDWIDCEMLDTRCVLIGEWWVAGEKRSEFAKKLGQLIDEYRI